MRSKLVIAGGTGFLGNALIKKYRSLYSEIVVLTRSLRASDGNVRYVQWDAKNLSYWARELESSHAVINLVGKSVNCRYTERNKREIIASRVDATKVIGMAIKRCFFPPSVWINAGSAAIFGNSGEEIKDEDSTVGDGFPPEVCKQWEKAFFEISTPQTRKVFLRIGLVLQPKEGLLKPFHRLVKFGLGGKLGTGEQYISWIHEEDFSSIVLWALERSDVEGILHVSSPFPVPNKVFMQTLRKASRIPFGLPHWAPFVHLGAVFIGTEGDLVLQGRRVVSNVLADKGYSFVYPHLEEALEELLP